MEEIFKKIKKEINSIKDVQEELKVLEDKSQELQDEFKKLEEEKNSISDKESGFYNDIKTQVEAKESEFRQADIERMEKEKEINKILSEKKQSIMEDLEAKKKYIDENRNADLQGLDLQKLKEEKEKLEKEIEMNDIPREEFDKLSESDKIAVRKAKENYLNNKHRLNEINPKIELMDTLDGKEPKDKYMEVESLIKLVDDKFNRDGLDEILENIPKEEKQETVEEEKDKSNYKTSDEIIEEALRKFYGEKKIEPETQKTQSSASAPTPETKPVSNNLTLPGKENVKNEGTPNIVLDINKDKIKINEKEVNDLGYQLGFGVKSDINKDYDIEGYFYNKRAKRNIDYSLIAALEQVDDKEQTLVKTYLNIISGKNASKDNIEKFNNAVNIEYKFNKDLGIFRNLKEKRLARNAKKLGIASLDGISEKGIWDNIKERFSKIRNTKLLKGKDETKALNSGKAEEQKRKAIDLIGQDREQFGTRVRVENKDNRIEEKAQKMQAELQQNIGKDVEKIQEEEQNQK